LNNLALFEQFGVPLALVSNYKYLKKIIAKMIHLSTEAYNNEQVSQNFSCNMPKID